MTLPTIHLNGTHPAQLLEDLNTAHGALQAALAAMRLWAAPNGRDYYPQGGDAFRNAVAEHESRLERLDSVMQEIDALREHASNALTEREERKGK